MKLRFRPVPPSRADRTVLPAALAAVLAMAAVAQLAISDPVELPPADPIGVGAPLPPVRDPAPRGVPGSLLSRPIFAPSGGAAAGDEQGAVADPLGGATILGSVGVGRTRYAVVQLGGATRHVPVGGSLAGWRLLGLGEESALLGRGGERLQRRYGAGATAGAPSKDAPASEDQE